MLKKIAEMIANSSVEVALERDISTNLKLWFGKPKPVKNK